MKPETGGSGFNPESQSNPYAQIPDLVRRSIRAKIDKARVAQRQLFKQIAADPYFDPVIIAIVEAQRILLTSKNQQQLKSSSDLLQSVIFEGYGRESPRQELVIRVSPEVVKAADKIMQNDEVIKKKPLLQKLRPPKYEALMNQFPVYRNFMHKDVGRGDKTLRIGFKRLEVGPIELAKIQQEGIRFNQWTSSFDEASNSSNEDPGKRDQLIDLLKTEPDFSLREKLFTRKCVLLSLQDIEAMEYPLSEENFTKITDFLIEVLSDDASIPSGTDKRLISTLFLNPTFFIHRFKPILYRNKDILANINSYQEQFINYLLFSDGEGRDEQVKKVLQNLPTGSYSIVTPLVTSVCTDIDPDMDMTAWDSDINTKTSSHPILYRAMRDFVENHGKKPLPPMVYLDEIGQQYLNTTVLPLFRERLKELGLDEKFRRDLDLLENLPKNTYAEYHLDAIRVLFEDSCGGEFLETLNAHTEEVQEITQIVWQDALERMHFLPMQEGENIIQFSKESVPSLLAINSIQMVRDYSQKDWNIYVLFRFQDITSFGLMALLTPGGKLEFKTPLQIEIPGLYTMLNHIAVLTFHDLVVQEKKEKERGSRVPTRQPIQQEAQAAKLEGDNDDAKERDSQSKASRPGNLPRVQQDINLIRDVYEATNRKPRRVELHDRLLPGAREYQAAVELYQEAITGNALEEIIYLTRTQLEEARENAFRISEGKRLNSPAKFQLQAITDPITGEMRYLKTWVVEHTSPRPTPEELSSPVKLYRRYYRGFSALASLDQMMPWFIGQ